ncbi:TadE family type IV pilus minor pilin [Micromonospora sp. KLBMP9576]|uniref:TadE family type IV pilus minor pilin n=1 Tax=Micromonospora sp. KLBMP9576 TaxID=3424769 RepID=UPI003D8E82EF
MTRRRSAGRDRGSFTAELAAGLPALLLLLFAGLSAVNAVGTKAGCLHAAREAALAASRGADGVPAAGDAAPVGAEVTVNFDGQRVVATVRAPVRALGSRLPRIVVTATAVAALEPGVAGAATPVPGAPAGGR